MKYRNQALTILAACSHFYLNGLTLGWMAPAFTKLEHTETSPLGYPINDGQKSLLSSLSFGGIYLISFAGTLSDRFGRKKILVAGALLRMIAWIIMTLSADITTLCIGKVLDAHVSGVTYPTVIIYLSEIASVPVRGLALTVTGLFSNLGILTMYIIGPFVSYKTQSFFPVVLSAVAFGIMLGVVVESPVFHMMKGKTAAANRSMSYLKRGLEIDEAREEMLFKKDQEKKYKAFKELFWIKKNLKAFSIACFLNVTQQFSGIVAFSFHMTSIFERAGSSVAPHISTIIVGAMQVVSCLTSSLLVERVGRRALLLFSSFMTALANLTLGLNFYLEYNKSPLVDYISWLPLTSLVVFIVSYWQGLGVIPSTLTGELLDNNVKSLGSSIICCIEILAAILVVSTYTTLNSYLGEHNTLWLFSMCCAATFVFSAIFVPETKGKTSAEIQKMLV